MAPQAYSLSIMSIDFKTVEIFNHLKSVSSVVNDYFICNDLRNAKMKHFKIAGVAKGLEFTFTDHFRYNENKQ